MLKNKLLLVTGATSGIGRATAIAAVKAGAIVTATGRNEAALAALQAEHGVQHTLVADLTAEGECERVANAAADLMKGLTTLINCAGVLQGGAIGAASRSNLMTNLSANTVAPFELMQHAVPHLREHKAAAADVSPSIVNVTSVNGSVSFAGVASYCASKAALDMLTKCAAVDLAPDGIRVNAVAPGVVITELQKRGGQSDEQYKAFIERSINVTHPLGAALQRVASADEVAELILFLASNKAAFITGDIVKIDGGRGCVGAR